MNVLKIFILNFLNVGLVNLICNVKPIVIEDPEIEQQSF